MKTEPAFLGLAMNPHLDQEAAFTICRMLDHARPVLGDDWNSDWLEKKRKNYRTLIDPVLLRPAWKFLSAKEWFSLQTVAAREKKISNIAPLKGMAKLRTLVLQGNRVEDLGPLRGMLKLEELLCGSNRIRDLTPLKHLERLEKLSIAGNPIESFRILEEVPNLRDLSISLDQVAAFCQCKRLLQLNRLDIGTDGTLANFVSFPELPALKVLKAWRVKDLARIERFGSLENLNLLAGKFSSLEPLKTLKALTHLTICSAKPVSVRPIAELYALRRLSINCGKVEGLAELMRLPALREIHVHDESTCNGKELRQLRKELSGWDPEFKAERKHGTPSLNLEVVDQEAFDYYDTKADYGIREGECNESMLGSERKWLLDEIREALSAKFEHDKDFHLPYTSGFRRSERVILYSIEAYEAFREIVLAIQEILCQTRNEWIIWCQSLLWEAPEEQEIPEGVEDFIVWIYPDKIMAARDNAGLVRKLVEWKQ